MLSRFWKWFNGDEVYEDSKAEMLQKKINWLEASVTEGKVREERLQGSLSSHMWEIESKEIALRLAYDFLYKNSQQHSHAGRICHILRRVLRGRTQLVGTEHALSNGIEAGHSPSNENLMIKP